MVIVDEAGTGERERERQDKKSKSFNQPRLNQKTQKNEVLHILSLAELLEGLLVKFSAFILVF